MEAPSANVSAQNFGSFVMYSRTQSISMLENILKYTKGWFNIEGKHLFAFSASVKWDASSRSRLA